MDTTQWKYTLDIYYNHPEAQPGKRTEDVKMYFARLNDAFEALMDIGLSHFVSGFYTRALISGPDGPELEARIERSGSENGLKAPGIYYHFPKGIKKFEAEGQQDLSDFKEYDPVKPYLLVSYLIAGNELKNCVAYDHRRRVMNSSDSVVPAKYTVVLSKLSFGADPASPRSPAKIPYREIFYHEDPGQAMRHLLSLDFNHLKESLAWENDLPFFYDEAYVCHDRYPTFGDNLYALTGGGILIGGDSLHTPGVFVSPSKSFADAVNWELFKKPFYGGNLYQIATLDPRGRKFEKVPELLRQLLPKKAAREKTATKKSKRSLK